MSKSKPRHRRGRLRRFLDRIAPEGYETAEGFFYGPVPRDQVVAVVRHEFKMDLR